MRPHLVVATTTSSAPSPWHPATAPAGSSSTPTTISPPPRSAPARAGDPGAPVRPARPARPGRRGLGLGDPTRPGSGFTASGDAAAPVRGSLLLVGTRQRLSGLARPATTDAEGRFTMRGVGRGLRLAQRRSTRGSPPRRSRSRPTTLRHSKPVTMALQPAKILTGRVTYADTGKPVPHARLQVSVQRDRSTRVTVDQIRDRRRRAIPRESFAGRPTLLSWPLLRRAALPRRPKRRRMAQGSGRASVDLAFPRAWIRGKVTEEGSESPSPGRGSCSSRILVRAAEYPAIARSSRDRGRRLVPVRRGFRRRTSRRPGSQRRLRAPGDRQS